MRLYEQPSIPRSAEGRNGAHPSPLVEDSSHPRTLTAPMLARDCDFVHSDLSTCAVAVGTTLSRVSSRRTSNTSGRRSTPTSCVRWMSSSLTVARRRGDGAEGDGAGGTVSVRRAGDGGEKEMEKRKNEQNEYNGWHSHQRRCCRATPSLEWGDSRGLCSPCSGVSLGSPVRDVISPRLIRGGGRGSCVARFGDD